MSAVIDLSIETGLVRRPMHPEGLLHPAKEQWTTVFPIERFAECAH